MKKIILTTFVTLIGLNAFASERAFTTCYVSMAIPSSTKNMSQVVRALPSYGILGKWSNNMGVISSVIQRQSNVTLLQGIDAGSISSFTLKLEGTEARPSVEVKAAIKSSAKEVLEVLRKNTPAADQKFLSVFLNGCSAANASDFGYIE